MKCFKRKKRIKRTDKEWVDIPSLPIFIDGEEVIPFEEEVIKLINRHRKNLIYFMKPFPILKENRTLNRIATSHSKYMAKKNKASHDNFPRRVQWCKDYADAKNVKEIVAAGFGTVKGVVNSWLNSPSHRDAIQWPKSVEYGVSVEKSGLHRNYFTVVFIEK